MARRKEIEWLMNELPTLTAGRVLTPEAADALRRYYSDQLGAQRSWLGVILTTLGALLVGAGVVSLLAYNWEQFSRPTRAALAYLPLLGGQVGAAWVLAKTDRQRTGAREGWGTFLFLAVGACLGLIAQTYHLGGRFDTFLLVWMLLGWPVAFVLEAVVPAFLAMIGFTCWSFMWKVHGGCGLWLWPLGALSMAAIWPLLIRAGEIPRTALVMAAATLMLFAAVGLTVGEIGDEYWDRGVPYLLYLSVGGVLYLASEYARDSRWERLFRAPRGLALIVLWVLGLALTFYSVWRKSRMLSPVALLIAIRSSPSAGWVAAAVVLIGAFAGVAVGLAFVVREKRWAALGWGVAPIIFMIATTLEHPIGATVLMNTYVLAVGVATIVVGLHERNAHQAYGGLASVILLIWFRFFDVDIGFVTRGIVFILLGMVFIAAQRVLARRMREAP